MDWIRIVTPVLLLCACLLGTHGQSQSDTEVRRLTSQLLNSSCNLFSDFADSDLELYWLRIKQHLDEMYDKARSLLERGDLSHISALKLVDFMYILSSTRERYAYRRITNHNPVTIDGIMTAWYGPVFSWEMVDFRIKRLGNADEFFRNAIRLLRRAVNNGYVMRNSSFHQLICDDHTDQCYTTYLSRFQGIFDPLLEEINGEPLSKIDDASTLSEHVLPHNIKKMFKYIYTEYLPHLRSNESLSAYPGGKDYYATIIRQFTSLDITPEEVHELGKREIRRIGAKLDSLKDAEGFDGTFKMFMQHTQEQNSTYFKSVEELEYYANEILDLAISKIDVVFKGPGDDYWPPKIGVWERENRPIAGYAPSATNARLFINSFKWKEIMRMEIMPLILHEGLPGHHSMVVHESIDAELDIKVKPCQFSSMGWPLSTWSYPLAIPEGWALYAESLGEEMGIYKTNMDLIGRYLYEMIRAVRMVIDTGVHFYGWSPERAVEFIVKHTYIPEHRARIEAARVVEHPGRSASYKLGELKIMELRRRAERRLGPRFDLRDFHHQILFYKLMSFEAIENQIDFWLDEMEASLSASISAFLPLLILSAFVAMATTR